MAEFYNPTHDIRRLAIRMFRICDSVNLPPASWWASQLHTTVRTVTRWRHTHHLPKASTAKLIISLCHRVDGREVIPPSRDASAPQYNPSGRLITYLHSESNIQRLREMNRVRWSIPASREDARARMLQRWAEIKRNHSRPRSS